MVTRISQSQRREELIAAAARVVLAGGLEALTIRGAAAEAGASIASVHYAFRDKTELRSATLDRLLGDYRAEVLDPVTETIGHKQACEQIIRGHWVWVQRSAGLARIVAETGLAPAPEGRDDHATAGADLISAALGRSAGPGDGPSDDLAKVVAMFLTGMTTFYAVQGDAIAIDRAIDFFCSSIMI